MLKYRCLLCGIEWGDVRATEGDISHGYCLACIRARYTDRIRAAQLKAGYSDCFNRGYTNCSEDACRFRQACHEDVVGSWKKGCLNKSDVLEACAHRT
jgi:hypothetical protein